jgi:hypothetical protein
VICFDFLLFIFYLLKVFALWLPWGLHKTFYNRLFQNGNNSSLLVTLYFTLPPTYILCALCHNLHLCTSLKILSIFWLYFLVVLWVELRALCILGKCSTTSAIPFEFVLVIWNRISLHAQLAWTVIFLFVLPHVAGDDSHTPLCPPTGWEFLDLNCYLPNLSFPSS